MSNIMTVLCLSLGWGAIVILVSLNLYNWCIRYINDEKLEVAGWGWLHIQAHKHLGFNFGSYPMPAVFFYLFTSMGIALASLFWFIALPVLVVAGVVLYLRYSKRKEKEDGKR